MSRAFTLIETLVAISIVTVAVSGPLVTASRSIVAAEIARDQLTASYLAQEAVEYVHAMRDDEYLRAYQEGVTDVSGTAWNWFLTEDPNDHKGSVRDCRNGNSCTLDRTQIMGTDNNPATESSPNRALHTCAVPSNCARLYLNSSHIYSQRSSGNTLTPFTRKVDVFDVAAGETRVVSKVSWSFHGTPYAVTITDHITAWQ